MFTDSMIVCIENQQRINKKPSGTNKWLYSKVAGYEVNVLKCIAFLYNGSKRLKFDIKSTVLFILTQKYEIGITLIVGIWNQKVNTVYN